MELHHQAATGRNVAVVADGVLIRSLVERVVVTTGTETEIELVGDIAAMVQLAHGPERRKAAPVGAALSATDIRSVKVVAGARNHRDRHSLVVTI